VVDIVAFSDSGVIDQVYLDPLRSAEPVTATGKLPRLRIGSSGDVSDERLSETRIEFRRINGAAPDAGTATFIGLGTRCRKLHRQP
jgi:hypothetical protein